MAALPSFPDEFNLATYYLDARVEEGRGDRVAVAMGDEERTYAMVQERANRVADALRARGIGSDDRVLMLLYDGFEFVEAWFGLLKAGGVFCMANPLGTAADFEHLLAYTRCRAVVADAEVMDRLAPLLADHPECHVRWMVGPGELPEGFERFEDALADASPETRNARTSKDDVAGWLFTSGTTGKPKGAVHLHRHFAFNTEVFAKRTLGLRSDDVFVSVSRLYFGYATGTNLMFPFAVGGKAVLFREKPTADRLFDHVAKHGVTVLTNVPAMIRQMVDSERDDDLSTVRIALSAGEALPPELYGRWKERFPSAELCDGIGSAEMFHIFITNRPGDVTPGSLGRLVEGYRARVVGPGGDDVAPGEIGRLHIAGDSTALCYWRRQDASRDTFRGEWCITQDLFRQDDEGRFWYAGRGDDMLKVRGQWVSPLEIEDCLATHPAVRECAVIGVPDDAGLTVPKAFVVLREGREASDGLVAELQEHAKTTLTRYKFPREVAFLDALPRNDRGKVMRRSLR